MPNWVRNHLTITGENASSVLKELLIENKNSICGYDLDFNKIKPMPEPLNIVSGSETNNGLNLYLTSLNPSVDYFGDKKMSPEYFTKTIKSLREKCAFIQCYLAEEEIHAITKHSSMQKLMDLGEKAFNNFVEYGAIDWYDWCCDNWGTKWNACETYVAGDNPTDVYFDTAWSPVRDLMRILSKKYPECTFSYDYAEEQPGYFAGEFVFKNGTCLEVSLYQDFSKKAYEKYFDLWGGEDLFKFNPKTGTYEYVENEGEM